MPLTQEKNGTTMDYETLTGLYRSRTTRLSRLKARGYNTAPYEKFGPIEISAMASAGQAAFRMDLERDEAAAAAEEGAPTKCRVLYGLTKIKNRLAGFMEELTNEELEDRVDPATTEVVVILLEPIADAFHVVALNAAVRAPPNKLRIAFFQAHTLVNNPFDHVLVPKHERLPSSEHAAFLKANKIKSKANLPLIKFHEDIIARLMGLQPGDIVKITRPSPTAGEYSVYRLCAP
jgi:DNA-directed RNA polymerase subunit H (RpoH/RPB5)